MFNIPVRVLTLLCFVAVGPVLGLKGRNKKVTYRVLRGEDLETHFDEADAIRIAYYARFPYYYIPSPGENRKQNLPILKNVGFRIVAIQDGKIVGALCGFPLMTAVPMLEQFRQKLMENNYDPKHFCFANKPIVLKSMQHQKGIEKGLLEAFAREAKDRGCTYSCMGCLDVRSIFQESEIPDDFVDVVRYIENDFKPLPDPLLFPWRVMCVDGSIKMTTRPYIVWISKLQ